MKVLNFIVLFLLLLNFSSLNAQNNMLIDQLANKLILRKNYDENGDLIDKQTFKAGKITESKGELKLKVITKLFDKSGKIKDKYNTIYRCQPKESQLMIMAFLFSDPQSKEIEISTTSKNFKNLYALNNLKDIEVKIDFDSSLLGSKSFIKIYDRTSQVLRNQIHINSKLIVKAYALGIRVKKLHYTIFEKLNKNGFLTFQKFKKEDSSYFTIKYKKKLKR